MQKTFNVAASSIYPLGVYFLPEGLHISAVCKTETDCGILLYDKRHKDGIKIPFPAESRRGNVHSMLLKGYQDRSCSYLFYEGEELFQDPNAYELVNERKYGVKSQNLIRCKAYNNTYDWQNDKAPLIPYEESIFYLLHVRGFTKHVSSGVRAKGTYAGIVEKIPYLTELGITALLLMPAYEFDEILPDKEQALSMEQAIASYHKLPVEQTDNSPRINYWGYQEGLYFVPKYAYSHQKDAVTEFKDMVKALHGSGMEVMMQFYFPPTQDYTKILRILKYWVLEYHIDGFHLMGVDIPMQMICKDPLFSDTKLLYEKDIPGSYQIKEHTGSTWDVHRNFALMNDAFLYDMRKLLKGDANMINRLLYLCRENYIDKGIVNYIAKQDGFRLYDLVSYDQKNNEANGEQNQDGNSYNFSWNCGIEGKTRKKSVLNLRMRQMKNAMVFIMLSQGTPLLYGGDEFGNTQDGNNNPYCQDNAVCWIKWNRTKMGEELLQFTKNLILLRKKYPILHTRLPLRGMDYRSFGYPDISFHGKDAWRPQTDTDSRSIGIMYCCRYGQPESADDSFLYFGINMHWEPHLFGLPQMPAEIEWVMLLATDLPEHIKETVEEESGGFQKVLVPPRTIVIYGTRKKQNIKEKKRNIVHSPHKTSKSKGRTGNEQE